MVDLISLCTMVFLNFSGGFSVPYLVLKNILQIHSPLIFFQDDCENVSMINYLTELEVQDYVNVKVTSNEDIFAIKVRP